jgi:phage gp29-like protein
MYTDPSIAKKLLPSLPQWQAIRAKADQSEEAYRDVRPMMSVLMRLRTADMRLSGHILTRTTAVTAFGWTIKPDDPKDAEDAKAAGLRLESVIREITELHMQSVLYDVLLIELVWSHDPSIDKWLPTVIKRYKPIELEKIDDNTVAVLADGPTLKRALRLSTVDNNDGYIIDISRDDHRGSLLRTICHGIIMKNDNWLEWSNFNKKLKGILQALWSADATDEEITAAKNALRTATTDNFVATSDAIKFIMNSITSPGGGTSFKEMIDSVQADVAIAILGQANTAELPTSGGSRAALQILNLIRADIHYADILRVERIVNNQLLAADYRLNYKNTAVRAPWKFEISIPEEINLETRARVVQDNFNAGIKMVAQEAYDYMGMTKPQSVGDELVRDAQPGGF